MGAKGTSETRRAKYREARRGKFDSWFITTTHASTCHSFLRRHHMPKAFIAPSGGEITSLRSVSCQLTCSPLEEFNYCLFLLHPLTNLLVLTPAPHLSHLKHAYLYRPFHPM